MNQPSKGETLDPPIRAIALFGARVLFGQERANIEALAALQSTGCEVICVVRPEPWPELDEIRRRLSERGLECSLVQFIDMPVRGYLLRTALLNPGRFILGNWKLMRLVKRRHATHLHLFNQQYAISFLPSLLLLNLPIVYRIGDSPILHRIHYRLIWRYLRRRVTTFIADSHYIKTRVTAAGVEPGKVRVLYAPPPERRRSGDVNIPPQFRAPNLLRFVYVGQLTAAKGLGMLIEAFAQLVEGHQQVRLLIAGPLNTWNDSGWLANLRAVVESRDELRARIAFLGFVEDVPELLARSDVHIAPSLSEEPYGLVVVEAKAAGRPSIVFPSGGMPELVQDGIDGFVCPSKSSSALAEAMARYCNDRALAVRHGRAAVESTAAFRFDTFSRQWIDVYTNAAGSRSRRDRTSSLAVEPERR